MTTQTPAPLTTPIRQTHVTRAPVRALPTLVFIHPDRPRTVEFNSVAGDGYQPVPADVAVDTAEQQAAAADAVAIEHGYIPVGCWRTKPSGEQVRQAIPMPAVARVTDDCTAAAAEHDAELNTFDAGVGAEAFLTVRFTGGSPDLVATCVDIADRHNLVLSSTAFGTAHHGRALLTVQFSTPEGYRPA